MKKTNEDKHKPTNIENNVKRRKLKKERNQKP